ncbi:metallophosphoesterase [Carnimonas nigrificans]|uniref:metallophosphoesterase n=1 Tax=Carnimonas nigrificans TaxID=64323 RepID=UPI00047040B6|nr:metallophosphoesterase [Carnimonas nigrificans]
MRLIQLSDIHLKADPAAEVRGSNPEQRFRAALRALGNERFDYLLLCGDVSDDGSSRSYQRIIEGCDALGVEWGWIPGNHDDPAEMVRHRPLLQEVRLGQWRLFGLDSWVEGWDGGEVGAEQLAALESRVEASDGPYLIALHHPPIEPPTRWMGSIDLRDKGDFWACIDRLSLPPAAVLSGHIHTPVAQQRGAAQVLTSPGCVDQFDAHQDEFTIDATLLPGYLVVTLDEQTLREWQVVRFPLE